jgi:hypothetical protein
MKNYNVKTSVLILFTLFILGCNYQSTITQEVEKKNHVISKVTYKKLAESLK